MVGAGQGLTSSSCRASTCARIGQGLRNWIRSTAKVHTEGQFGAGLEGKRCLGGIGLVIRDRLARNRPPA